MGLHGAEVCGCKWEHFDEANVGGIVGQRKCDAGRGVQQVCVFLFVFGHILTGVKLIVLHIFSVLGG